MGPLNAKISEQISSKTKLSGRQGLREPANRGSILLIFDGGLEYLMERDGGVALFPSFFARRIEDGLRADEDVSGLRSSHPDRPAAERCGSRKIHRRDGFEPRPSIALWEAPARCSEWCAAKEPLHVDGDGELCWERGKSPAQTETVDFASSSRRPSHSTVLRPHRVFGKDQDIDLEILGRPEITLSRIFSPPAIPRGHRIAF